MPTLARPVHLAFRSPDPSAGDIAGYTVATSMDAEVLLLEMRPTAAVASRGPVPWSRLIPPERHFITFAPDPAGSPGDPKWPLVRADCPDAVISRLPEFLASPEASAQLFR